jgi:hypothetical protein
MTHITLLVFLILSERQNQRLMVTPNSEFMAVTMKQQLLHILPLIVDKCVQVMLVVDVEYLYYD